LVLTVSIAPTRNNYWVNDNDNTAAWAPVNQATNLILSNSNSSVLSQAIVLAQNRECECECEWLRREVEVRMVVADIPVQPGTAHYSAHISNLAPGNNYIIWLTLAGDPSRE
jgi:hypothetical protein